MRLLSFIKRLVFAVYDYNIDCGGFMLVCIIIIVILGLSWPKHNLLKPIVKESYIDI